MRYLPVALLIFMTGCASFIYTQEKFRTKLEAKWLGKTGTELVTHAGIPERTMSLDEGGKVYQYSESNKSYSTSYDHTTREIATNENVWGCTVYFITDAKDVIRTINFKGNTCTAR